MKTQYTEERRTFAAPIDAPTPTFRHPKFGDPDKAWEYQSMQGDIYGYICRWDRDGKKYILPLTWDGKSWGWGAFSKPRPLLNLQILAASPDAQIVLVEGEKAADAAARLFPQKIAMTWPGGAQAIKYVDWEPLKGRSVVLWPDADEPGIKAMQAVGDILTQLGCSAINILDVSDHSDGWDAADFQGTTQQAFAWAKSRAKKFVPSVQPVAPKTRFEDKLPATEYFEPATVTNLAVERKKREAKPKQIHPQRTSWEDLGLILTENGVPVTSLDNCIRVLERHEAVAGKLWVDVFLQRMLHLWNAAQPAEWRDVTSISFAAWLQREICIPRVSSKMAYEAAVCVAERNTRNELTDWLDTLLWDGTPRIETMLPIGFGTDSDDYHGAIGRNWLISMVARAFAPGCQADYAPVLEGGQGVGKSTALRILGGKYCASIHESIVSKDFQQAIQGKWLIEIAEMHSFSRAEVQKIKAVITERDDRYRGSYERLTCDHPRQCILAGTTNQEDWQNDPTGARRFWPFKCGRIDLEWLRTHRDQLFAEAVTRYRAGESWWAIPEDRAAQEQADRQPHDAWEPPISAWLVGRSHCRMGEVLEGLGIEIAKQSLADQQRAGRALRKLGWELRNRKIDGKQAKVWVHHESHIPSQTGSLFDDDYS